MGYGIQALAFYLLTAGDVFYLRLLLCHVPGEPDADVNKKKNLKREDGRH